MKILLAIGLGSFVGGILRYLITQLSAFKSASGFPFATLTVNVLGCLLIGVVYGLSEKNMLATEWRIFFATGVLAGFTTFSAFSFETFEMFRQHNIVSAFIYIALSVVLGLTATYVGFMLAKA